MLSYLIFIYLFVAGFKIYLAIIDSNFIAEKSQEKPVVLSESEYKKSAIIQIQNHKFDIFSLIFDAFTFLLWAFFGLELLYKNIVVNDTLGENVVFVMSFIIISALLELPFEIYEQFVKNKKQGFSNITPKIYILDKIKALLLTLIFGSAFVWLLLWCIKAMGELWWFWAFLLSFGIILIINLIYPTLIAPIFNKVKPLEDGELKTAISELLNSCGFKSSGVFSMDASKRDNRLNAYFGGFGVSKRVVLFDTLIQKLSTDEIIAVLGHELGHFKHGDIFKMIGISALMLFCMFGLFGNVSPQLYEALGLSQNGGSIIVFMILFLPIYNFAFSPITSYLSRKNEFGADEFGASSKSKNDMINALKKLGSQNKAFPMSHPLYAFIYHSHPSLFERITKLENDDTRRP
ncbi:MAG: M48 family metallopeptidase [Campylobacter sp.]|nr:M48 family metallopeptidase [Campylobacter sp.]